MANSLSLPGSPGVEADAPRADEGRLASVRPSESVRVVAVSQDADVAAWLRAVGLSEGAHVTVLRRAPFGGPIHIRTSDGGEFALHRDLARSVGVAPLEADAGDRERQGRKA
jgi:ferrous iron transport protein A